MIGGLITAVCFLALVILAGFMLKRHGNLLMLRDCVRYLKDDEAHAVVRLTEDDCKAWDHPDRGRRRESRSTIASRSVQDVTNCSLKSVAVVDQAGRVLLLAHRMEEDNWGFLELGQRGRPLLDELIREKPTER